MHFLFRHPSSEHQTSLENVHPHPKSNDSWPSNRVHCSATNAAPVWVVKILTGSRRGFDCACAELVPQKKEHSRRGSHVGRRIFKVKVMISDSQKRVDLNGTHPLSPSSLCYSQARVFTLTDPKGYHLREGVCSIQRTKDTFQQQAFFIS
ncbi:hypothetical protein TNCT_649761 [Trichonephila clavata]|uniref:Uncharacterized protein n=1 Tax=Trichonephila clavata TaxID=2740835 RepID=A0A8X6KYB7_TRICU|nr:hypothetical protein TNCT_649761 [Trichonephila clavata]